MNLIDLINQTADHHQEFRAAVESNLDQQLQQFVLRNQADSEYELGRLHSPTLAKTVGGRGGVGRPRDARIGVVTGAAVCENLVP